MSKSVFPLDDRYQKDPSIVFREIAGEAILVPIRQNVGDLESIFTLNETAARIWALLDGQHSLGDIRDLLVLEFEVDDAEAEQDLLGFIESLSQINAIHKV